MFAYLDPNGEEKYYTFEECESLPIARFNLEYYRYDTDDGGEHWRWERMIWYHFPYETLWDTKLFVITKYLYKTLNKLEREDRSDYKIIVTYYHEEQHKTKTFYSKDRKEVLKWITL